MDKLFKSLLMAGASYGFSEILLRGEGSQRRIKRMIWGVVMIFGAAAVAVFALVALLASFFFLFSDVPELAQSALLTSGLAWLLAAVILFEGWRMLFRVWR